MIILLHGKDNFRSLQKLALLTKTFVKKKKGEVVTIDSVSPPSPRDQLGHHLAHLGLFATEKLIILKSLFQKSDPATGEALVKTLSQKPSGVSVIVYERENLDTRKKAIKQLLAWSIHKGKPYYPEFCPPTPLEIRRNITAILKRSQKEIEPAALDMLTASCADSWQVHYETHKLISNGQTPITTTLITDLLTPKLDDNIFHLTDALAQKNITRVLTLLEDQLESRVEPLYLLNMIGRHIRILMKIKSAQASGFSVPAKIAAEIDEHPFVVQKSLASARGFTAQQLTKWYAHILISDRTLKSSRIPAPVLLTKLVYDILGTKYPPQ